MPSPSTATRSWTFRLVAYGSASTKDDPGASQLPVLKLVARVTLWNLLPNGKGAHFYNFWAGLRRRDAVALGPAHDRAGHVEQRRGAGLARHHELGGRLEAPGHRHPPVLVCRVGAQEAARPDFEPAGQPSAAVDR